MTPRGPRRSTRIPIMGESAPCTTDELENPAAVAPPGQELAIEDFLRYSRRFGVIHPHPSKSTRHPDHPEITLLGVNKFGPDGRLDAAIYRRGAEGWHTDGAYDAEPFKATQLYALAVP